MTCALIIEVQYTERHYWQMDYLMGTNYKKAW